MIEFLIKAEPGLMAQVLRGIIPALQNAGVDVGTSAQPQAEQVTVPVVVTKKAATPVAEQAPAQATETKEEKSEAAPAMEVPEGDIPSDIEHIRLVAREKQQEGKKDALRALLGKFGAPNLTSLQVDAYSAFYAELKKL